MTTHVSKDVEQGEYSFIAGGSENLYNHYGNQYGIDLPQDPAIPFSACTQKTLHPTTKILAQQCS